ncbi:uncharacterized protein LOC127138547 [Lathyrus oleraceus]|uniref:uncharacterized protein LOC127138547 n=1 Tax=Pisum sativum TaxID=3888 RepID=UPI0021D073BA|nr:uncharacterized protein LOC127138547 [Pisum sativum]
MDPIKYIFEKPVVTSRIARWQMLLTEYDIQYVTKKVIKGSVLSNYLAHLPVEGYQPLRFDFPNEDIMFIRDFAITCPKEGPEPGSRWTLVFNGASNARGHGICAVIISPTGFHLPFTARLCFDCTNNMAEYKVCIYSMEAAIDLRIKILEVYKDSALVISHVKGDWETHDTKLIPYKEHIRKRIPHFDEVSFYHIPREENQLVDALATLASMFKIKWKNEAFVIHTHHLDEPAHCLAIEADPNDKPWFYDIKTFLEKQQYPEGISIIDKKALRRFYSKFLLKGDVLYKRNYDFMLLRCVDRHKASTIIKSIHEGCEGVHAKGPAMAKKILQDGYYWTTMEVDYYNFVRRCHKCQIYGDMIYVPPTPLNVLTSPWPFSMWGIDMIGMIKPKASNDHQFIIVVIDYFTKWVEVASYANVTRQVVTRFIKKEIIFRSGIPRKIITNNTSNLNINMMKELCEEFKIEHHNSSPYRPKMNGAVEAANKNIKRIIQKMVKTYKDWHEMLPFALHTQRTSVRTSTRATPYSLVYRIEVVLPIEVEIPSLRVIMESDLDEVEWVQSRYNQLNLIEEKRLMVVFLGQLYQRRFKRAFDKKVLPREYRS